MMKSWKPLVCGAAYAVVAIIPTFLLTVGPATAATVTASASGTFDDAAGWTAVATWDDSVMADNVVSISEMLTFTVTTAVGPILGGGFYDLTDVIFTGGFTFDGPSASAGVIGGISGWYFDAYDVATATFLLMLEGTMIENRQDVNLVFAIREAVSFEGSGFGPLPLGMSALSPSPHLSCSWLSEPLVW
jgi:hypothetical protein